MTSYHHAFQKTHSVAKFEPLLEMQPIPPAVFSEALTTLPLSSLYAKISELQNSIAHLERSNVEIRQFLDESADQDPDPELEDAITENGTVIGRMLERIGLVELELERRGQRLTQAEAISDTQPVAAAQSQPQSPSESITTGESGAVPNGNTCDPDGSDDSDSRRPVNSDDEHAVYL